MNHATLARWVTFVPLLLLSAHGYALQPQDVASKVLPSVVVVNAMDDAGNVIASGSGFFVAKDTIASNLHVLQGARRGAVRLVNTTDDTPILGYVGVDATNDLVLLKISHHPTRPLVLRDKADVRVGDTVYVVGNPQGLEGTFSQGIVSAKREVQGNSILQITAPISPGSSGGPVLATDATVIGVAVAFVIDGQNLNFAIPSLPLLALINVAEAKTEVREISSLPKRRQLTRLDIFSHSQFCSDVVRLLREIYEKRTAGEFGHYETFFRFSKGIRNARLILEPWQNDDDPIRTKGRMMLLVALDDLQEATEIAMNSRFPLDQRRAAQFKVNLDEGSQMLYRATLVLMHPRTGLPLSDQERDDVADFAKRVFPDELKEFRKRIDDDETYRPGWDVFGAAVIAGEFPK
jgi:hypothetical protein